MAGLDDSAPPAESEQKTGDKHTIPESIGESPKKAARLAAAAAAGAAAAKAAAHAARARNDIKQQIVHGNTPPSTPSQVALSTPEKGMKPLKKKSYLPQPPDPWEKTLDEEKKLLKAINSSRMEKMDVRKKYKTGQKFPTPPAAEAQRAFYQSLLSENPDSKMAVKYCVEFGVCTPVQHKEIFKKYEKIRDKTGLNLQQRLKLALYRKEAEKKNQMQRRSV